jgi:hypothetical protein
LPIIAWKGVPMNLAVEIVPVHNRNHIHRKAAFKGAIEELVYFLIGEFFIKSPLQ